MASDSKYKVSALAYRPQRFSEVVSQEFATKTLKNAIISGKTAHSYLFSGPRGTGKTTIARIFAKALNCLNPVNGEPCNKCENCIEITNGSHPDVFELDAASNRGIDDVRAIQDAAKYFPVKAKFKFFIVDEVHMLTIQAFNALLKTLEEPPAYLIFILATTNPEKVPATILSRCQKFGLHRLKIEEITEQLRKIANAEKISIDDDSLFLISKLGDGALRDALGIFDLAVSYCGNNISIDNLKEFLNIPDKEIYFKISDFIKNADSKAILEYFSELLEQGFDLITFYNGITEHFRNILLIIITSNPKQLDEPDNIREKYLTAAKDFTADSVLRLLKILLDNEARLKYSGNQKILLEVILTELCRIEKEVFDIATLIAELEALKKKTPNNLISRSGSEIPSAPVKSDSDNVIRDSEVVAKLKQLFVLEEHFISPSKIKK